MNYIKEIPDKYEICKLDIVTLHPNLVIEFKGQYWRSEQVLLKKNRPNSYYYAKFDNRI